MHTYNQNKEKCHVANLGQEYDIYRIKTLRSEGKVAHKFRKEIVGRVRITALVDYHFSYATIISGEAKKNDIVKLESSNL